MDSGVQNLSGIISVRYKDKVTGRFRVVDKLKGFIY